MNINILNDYKSRGLLYNQVHPTLPLIIWNYTPETQYGGRWDEVTLNCRGLVTDTDGKIIAKGFPKFFNMEEERHVATDNFEVFEKLDGSFIIVFWYDGQMIVASRGSFTSDHAVEAKRLLDEKYPKFVKYISMNRPETYSFCFELIGFEQIVVSYSEPDLILTGLYRNPFHNHASNLYSQWTDGFYKIEPVAVKLKIKLVKKFEGLDWKNIKQLNWQNAEGFVVRFSNGDRCKIKFEDYIALHRQMTNLSTTGIWEALKDGKPVSSILNDVPDEFYNKVHEYETLLTDKYRYLDTVHNDFFELLQFKCPIRKDFAERVNALPNRFLKGVLFSMLDGKDYSKQIWQQIKPKYEKI